MGIIDFIKNAGRKDDKDAIEAQEEMNRELIKANKLKRFVLGVGLDIQDLKIGFNDGVATIQGKAATQADREKAVLAVGNTDGVARVDDRMQVTAVAVEAKLYTVKKGDSLSKIAKEFYGDPKKYPAIFEANKPMLENPDLIYPGQVLRIPSAK